MAHIIFTEDSFAQPYSLLSRTYRFSSDKKAFRPNMAGYSIFAYCLDETSDQGVRLDWYMEAEGNAGGWRVEGCYILERMRDAAAIPDFARAAQDGSLFLAPNFLVVWNSRLNWRMNRGRCPKEMMCRWGIPQSHTEKV